MVHYEYDLLKNLMINNDITNIKEQYIKLLSYLTKIEDISDKDFINKIEEILKIGVILVCYFKDEDKIYLIGSGTIIYEPKLIRNCKYSGHIEDIVVHESYRKQGIANDIIKILINNSKKRNCYKVTLDCKDNLCSFYNKLGFETNGKQMCKYFTT